MDIKRLAERLVDKHGTRDPFRIAEELGYTIIHTPLGVNPKFCVNSIWVQIEQNLFRAVAVESGCCHVNNITRVGSDVKWEEEQFILPLTSGHGGVTRAYARQSRWPSGRGSGSSPAAVQSTFS